MSLTIDDDVLKEAMAYFGIHLPVVIKCASMTRNNGVHQLRNGKHHIKLASHLPAKRANEILLHELQHAGDCEAHGRNWDRAYKKAGANYKNNRFEHRAKGAEVLGKHLPIIIEGR